MTAKDAPSTIAMLHIGKDFQQFDSDTTAMVLLEGQDKLGDDAHRFYDKLIDKLSQDTTHIEHINNFWGDPLTAAGSQSADAKSAYVQLNLRGDQGGTEANDSVAAVQRIVEFRTAAAGHQGLCHRSRSVGRRPPRVRRQGRAEDHPRHPGGDRGDAAGGLPFDSDHGGHAADTGDRIVGRERVHRGTGQLEPHRTVHLCDQPACRVGDRRLDRLRDLLGRPISGGQIQRPGS